MTRTKAGILSGVASEVSKSRKVANNTVHIYYTNGIEAWRLHDTDVVSLKDEVYTLNSGGWRTSTTKERIGSFSPARLYQQNGVWYIGSAVFYDGIQINKDGEIISEIKKDPIEEVKKIKSKIAKFVKLITKDNLPTPNNGDCWYCLMNTDDGQTLGDSTNNHQHLLAHMKEGYMHGSLLVNAMREMGYRDEQIGYHYSLKIDDTFKRAVRRYLQKRLIANISLK